MTPFHDLFVGLAAIFIGCLLIGGSLVESRALMALAKSRLLVQRLGKTAARWTIAALGVACIAMGGLIASGWRIHW